METIDFYNGLASQSHCNENSQFETSTLNSDKLILHLHMLSAQNLLSSADSNARQLPEPTHGAAISNGGLLRDPEVDNCPRTGGTWPDPNAISLETSTTYCPPNCGTQTLFDSFLDSGAFTQEQVRMVDDPINLSSWLSLPYNSMLSCSTENLMPITLSRNLISAVNITSDDSFDSGTTYLDWSSSSFSQNQSTPLLLDPLLSTLPYDLQQWSGEASTSDIAPLEDLALERARLSDSITSGTWMDNSQVIPNLFTSDPLFEILPNHLNPSRAVSGSVSYDFPSQESLSCPGSLLDGKGSNSQLTIHRSEILQHTFQNHNTRAITSSTTEVIQSFAKPLRPNKNIPSRRENSGPSKNECLSSRQGRKRRPFQSLEDKQQTSQTRELKACVRCRMQRIRCILDKDNPDNPCISCQKLQKSIFRLPCLRYIITDSLLCRNGPSSPRFCASLRWWGKTLTNITEWEPGHDRVIEISQGHGPSISVRVRRFIPEPDDQLAYRWLPNGVARPYGFANIVQPGSVQLTMPPYAIANIGEAASAFRKYIDGNVLTYLNLVLDASEPISFRIFHMAYRYAQTHSVELLKDCLTFWTACRLTEGRWTICGRDTLGVVISNDPDSPFCGKAPLTPMMLFQGDQILLNRVIKPLRKSLLAQLQKLVLANKPSNWFTIFLCAFVLLQNYELCCAHDVRFSKLQNLKTRWSNQALIDGYQSGANTIIAHFRYCNKGYYPFDLDWASPKEISIAELDHESAQFLASLSKLIRGQTQRFKKMKDSNCFEESLHFASQLFIE